MSTHPVTLTNQNDTFTAGAGDHDIDGNSNSPVYAAPLGLIHHWNADGDTTDSIGNNDGGYE
jgi:hypothetical protein